MIAEGCENRLYRSVCNAFEGARSSAQGHRSRIHAAMRLASEHGFRKCETRVAIPLQLPNTSRQIRSQGGVQVREQLAAAGRLPAQRVAEFRGIELDQTKIRLTSEILAQGLGQGLTRRQVDIAIEKIDWRSHEAPFGTGCIPV